MYITHKILKQGQAFFRLMPPKGRRREPATDGDGQVSRQDSSTSTRRRLSDDASEAGEEFDNKLGIPESDISLMVKNFIRLALASEHTRTPIRREDVSKKVFVNDHKRCFALVFERTQARLKDTLGMQLLELPARDRLRGMTMTQQRKAAHSQASHAATGSTQSAGYKSNKSWVLQNLLPPNLKQISQRQHVESDRNYNAVVTVLLVIVVMSDDQACTESRAMSALERLGWTPTTPAGPYDDVVAKMVKQGYLERIKDNQGMDGGTFSLCIGPRGKLETLQNRDELFSVISTIYGTGNDVDATARLKRIIQDTLDGDEDAAMADPDAQIDGGGEEENDTATQNQPSEPRRKKVFRERAYENDDR